MSDEFEIHQMLTDTCLFVRRKRDGKIILLCLYVDDIYLATSTTDIQEEFLTAISKIVDVKNLGVPDQLLGITLSWGRISVESTLLSGSLSENLCSYAILTAQL